MGVGSVQSTVVCVPAASASEAQQVVCPVVGGQFFAPQVVAAYLVEPAQGVAFEAQLGPFDYGHAAALWSMGFTMVVGLYVVSHGIGSVLGFIRRG